MPAGVPAAIAAEGKPSTARAVVEIATRRTMLLADDVHDARLVIELRKDHSFGSAMVRRPAEALHPCRSYRFSAGQTEGCLKRRELAEKWRVFAGNCEGFHSLTVKRFTPEIAWLTGRPGPSTAPDAAAYVRPNRSVRRVS